MIRVVRKESGRLLPTESAIAAAQRIDASLRIIDIIKPGDLDPSHAARLSAVEECARIMSDASVTAPLSLKRAPIIELRHHVLRLAADAADPRNARPSPLFANNAELMAIEARMGWVSAILVGLAECLKLLADAQSRPLPHERPNEARSLDDLVMIPLSVSRNWQRRVVSVLAHVDRDIICSRDSNKPINVAIVRDAWMATIAFSCLAVSAADNEAIDVVEWNARLTDGGLALKRMFEVLKHRKLSGTTTPDGFTEKALLALAALAPVAQEATSLIEGAFRTRQAQTPRLFWRALSKGRTALQPGQVLEMIDATIGKVAAKTPINTDKATALREDLVKAANESLKEAWDALT